MLIVENVERSCKFYSKISDFELIYGSSNDTFATFKTGEEGNELKICQSNKIVKNKRKGTSLSMHYAFTLLCLYLRPNFFAARVCNIVCSVIVARCANGRVCTTS